MSAYRALRLADGELVLGGPPVFEPAGSEWMMRAQPLMDPDPERARDPRGGASRPAPRVQLDG